MSLTGNYNETGTNTVTVVFTETNGWPGYLPSTFTTTNIFTLSVTFVPQPPTIGFIPNQVTYAGDAILNLPFVIGSPDTNAGNLSITVSSGNQALLPTAGGLTNVVVTRGLSNGMPPVGGPNPSSQTNYLSLYPTGVKGNQQSVITVAVSHGYFTNTRPDFPAGWYQPA